MKEKKSSNKKDNIKEESGDQKSKDSNPTIDATKISDKIIADKPKNADITAKTTPEPSTDDKKPLKMTDTDFQEKMKKEQGKMNPDLLATIMNTQRKGGLMPPADHSTAKKSKKTDEKK